MLPGRIGKQCRERYFNHLDPTVKKGKWSVREDTVIFAAQIKMGNQWCEIAKRECRERRKRASEASAKKMPVCGGSGCERSERKDDARLRRKLVTGGVGEGREGEPGLARAKKMPVCGGSGCERSERSTKMSSEGEAGKRGGIGGETPRTPLRPES
jgi:hypothetical protein